MMELSQYFKPGEPEPVIHEQGRYLSSKRPCGSPANFKLSVTLQMPYGV